MTQGDRNDDQDHAIAIIGISGRFPGASNVATFWKNLREGRESIRVFSEEELLASGVSLETVRDPAYVKACGYLDGIDQFDAAFFGLSPRDAAVFDPQHRFFLECSWEAFEDAGYVGEKIDGRVGVFASSGATEYFTYNLVTNQEVLETIGAWLLRHTGNDSNFLATRVSYELNLSGPSMNVQTACSSSLVAVHVACQSLLNGECDVALAGGSTIYPEQTGYLYRPGEILSPDGHCRPFDADASGTVMASATGCVLLKRLSDAIRDGDCIRAVIRASAVNNDGSDKVGYLAPSVSGQARVISEALDLAGIDPSDVSYIEAHGTGTLIGDPIEVAALVEAFGPEVPKQSCAIGSLKSNIGHAGEASGICGLIKVICALEHRELPASLHYRKPNPQADLSNTPFFVNADLQPWNVRSGKRRIAGITSLGAGGTNAHLVLEEAPPRRATVGRENEPQLLVLSARSNKALDAASKNLADHLRGDQQQRLDDVAFTLMNGRESFECRRAFVANSAASAALLLDENDVRRVFTGKAAREPHSTAFLFPGGGAQYCGMGAELYEKFPEYRKAIDECLAVVQPELGVDLRSLMFAPPSSAEISNLRLAAPSLALPALFATEYALAKLLASWGVTPAALIGHSAGEYAAACVAGVLSMHDAISLVAMRGRLFEKLPRGAMLSIPLPEAEARAFLCDELSIAAINGPALCVASGPVRAIANLEQKLSAAQVEFTRVHIDVAAHSAMLQPILPEFERYCRKIAFQKPRIPFVSNLTGTWITDAEATDPTYWVRHLRNTVRFDEGAATLLQTRGVALIEVGPGRTLSSLCRQQPVKAAVVANTLRHSQESVSDVGFLLEAVGKVWAAGGNIDLSRLERGSQRRVPLPTYPFEHQRYWIEKGVAPSAQPQLKRRNDLTTWFSAPSFHRSVQPDPLSPEELGKPWLIFTDGSSLASALVTRLRRSGATVATVEAASRFAVRGGLAFGIDPSNAEDYARLKAELRQENASPAHVVHLWALAQRPWRLLRSAPDADLAAWDRDVVRYYDSLFHLSQAFALGGDSFRLTAIGTAIEALEGEREVHPEKATLAGVCRVLPRETPEASCSVVDVVVPPAGSDAEAQLADRLLAEVQGDNRSPLVVLRKNGRWVQRFEQLPLEPAPTQRAWLRERGVYLITGGLGGIGLEVMEHLALHGKARLVSVGRSALPEEAAWNSWLNDHGEDDDTSRKIRGVRKLRAMGAEVMLAEADVTDRRAMAGVISEARRRFGRINGVFHSAGLLQDQLIALRPPVAHSAVLDVKAKGALVLQSLFGESELDFLVLFSSVSSVLGLPGQVDYTAANAFLDSLAKARAARGCRTRTISIDWNAWKVGMLATLVREPQQHGVRAVAHTGPPLGECLSDDAEQSRFRSALSRKTHWVLGDHVVKGGQSVMPGTGYLELARAALAHRPEDRPIEIRDLTFLQPFTVGVDETRTLNITLSRNGDHIFTAFGDSKEQPFATAHVAYFDAPAAPQESVPAIRQRCSRSVEVPNGRLVQHFMDFGPRWANIESIQFGENEALIHIALPDAYSSDLAECALHPGMLDMATGAAQMLIPGFNALEEFYVPFSYGRVLVRQGLTSKLYSHVRLRSADGKSAIFDATLLDEHGNVLVSVERYIMRRAQSFATTGVAVSDTAASAKPRVAESAAEGYLREGMTPSEGLEALDRILANDISPQIIASTLDVELWLSRLNTGAHRVSGARSTTAQVSADAARSDTDIVAPRDTVERELAAMWKEMLGVPHISITDDFFELGGQSLIAVRLLNRICKHYAVELPLSVLFQAPTIAATAELLRGPFKADEAEASSPPAAGDAPPATDSATSIKPLETAAGAGARTQPAPKRFQYLVSIAKGGNRPALFCVHGAGGNVLNFRDISRGLQVEQPFFGLQARGIDGTSRPHESIEEMAKAYLEEIRIQQPHGPYLLAGYSGGGVVAFEMARQLTELGEDVPLVVFFDTYHPQMPIQTVDFARKVSRLRNEGLGYLRDIVSVRLHWLREARERWQISRCIRQNKIVPLHLRNRHLTDNFGNAASKYHPEPWSGRAILFRAASASYVFRSEELSYGWDKVITGGVETVVIPGNHDTLMLGANSQVLMGHLNRALEKACAKPSDQAGPAAVFHFDSSAELSDASAI
ncbi:type I polyketide synthase [Hyphomicrobium sp.]|uniref:type I polyketide synthase n=1 Tax=Hyphomicrobium sp. TaxID=82 RepID=UPI001D3528DB|nr:type I polyketide synthase [Hyphomicrobium sp.]MBY0561315.1 SDR family NAD(P)-dependent oxidoreductase [Hyphomicrobium sp.]